MAHPAVLSRPARLAALSAAALLALTACGGQDSADSGSSSAPASSEQAQGTASTEASASTSSAAASSSALSASPASYEAGTCFTAALGARDLSSFETVDCADAHTAEYLWAVPAAEEGAEVDPAAAQACTAQGQRLTAEKGEELEGVVLSSAELGNYGTDEKHCAVYAVSGEWQGQIVDPEITLEKAVAESAAS